MIAIGRVPPDKTKLFFTLSREIAADLVANPISDDELRRAKEPLEQLVLRAATSSAFWMMQFSGSSYDPRRVDAARAILDDYKTVTAADVQAMAAKYLRPDKDWTMEVVPKSVAAKEGLTVAAGQ